MNLPQNVLAALGVSANALAHTPSRAIADPTAHGRLVPNEFPIVEGAPYRVAIVGEAPGENEDKLGRPFCGASGQWLDRLLTTEGMSRPTVFVGNICSYRPPDNEISKFEWEGDLIQSSLKRLEEDLNKFDPNICVLLGRYALRAAVGEMRSMEEWRGSVFIGTHGPFKGRKCIASYHPAYVMRDWEKMPMLRFDLRRATLQGKSKDLVVKQRHFKFDLSVDEIIAEFEKIRYQFDLAEMEGREYPAVHVSFDLEGYWDRITRFSIATSDDYGFIVPLTKGEFDSHWSLQEEVRLWRAIARLLQDERIPKVLQNSLYDRFVLAYLYKILIKNVSYDTMLGHWELYCELPNSLGFQGSIYTNEPHWKEDRTSDDLRTRELYCCKDSAVTEEIRTVQKPRLLADTNIWNHFQFNIRLLNPVLFMELRGLKYDSDSAKRARLEVYAKLWEKQHAFNVLAGMTFVGTRKDLLAICKERLVKKKEQASFISFLQLPAIALKKFLDKNIPQRLAEMESLGLLTDTQLVTNTSLLGELESMLEIGLNVRSNEQMVDWFYIKKRYERQYNKDKNGVQRLSCDVMAMLNLYRKNPSDTIPKVVLQIRSLLYQAQVLGIVSDPDGRVRCGYNIVAAETARTACYESPTGSGYNLQTVTKKLRYLFLADDGHWLAQCDLAGADGWTVAAHCASLGDRTMLDDYLFGLKPARLIALMYMALQDELKTHREQSGNREPDRIWYEHALSRISIHFNSLTREQLKVLSKQVDSDGWLYFASKRVQHGSNYDARQATLSDIVLKDSHKFLGEPIYVEPRVCGYLQRLYLNRYVGIPRWHARVTDQLLRFERLTAASGRVRRFFGRLRDGRDINHETLKAGLSNEPQDNTTFATNRALLNLWEDPDNRDSHRRCGLIVEPLHVVHDALITQFPKDLTEWAVKKHHEWFKNELTIAGLKITIPFEGAYGRSWGELTEGVI